MDSPIRTLCRDLVRDWKQSFRTQFKRKKRTAAVARRIARLTDRIDELYLIMQAMEGTGNRAEWDAVHREWNRLEYRRRLAILKYQALTLTLAA